MEGWLKLITILFIAISCFHIQCNALAIPHEISRRAFAAPDPEKALKEARLGVARVVIAAQHTADNEFSLIEAKENPAPPSSDSSSSSKPASSDLGVSTANMRSATSKEK